MTRSSNIIVCQGDNLTIDSSRASYTKKFPRTYASKGAKIGLLSMSAYYSWDNLTASFNNLTGASYIFNGTTYPVNYTAGNYSTDELNQYLEYIMEQNLHFLVDANGNNVYYLSFQSNDVSYCTTLIATPIPTVLPTGWTNPNGITLSGNSPQLVVSGATNWYKLLGLSPGTYPAAPATVTTSINGTLIPIITGFSTIFVVCNMVNDSRFSNFPSVIASFVPNQPYGSLLTISPPVITTYDVIPQNYDSIEIRLVDELFRPLIVKDNSQTCFTLLLEEA